jgi:hypothetical protein
VQFLREGAGVRGRGLEAAFGEEQVLKFRVGGRQRAGSSRAALPYGVHDDEHAGLAEDAAGGMAGRRVRSPQHLRLRHFGSADGFGAAHPGDALLETDGYLVRPLHRCKLLATIPGHRGKLSEQIRAKDDFCVCGDGGNGPDWSEFSVAWGAQVMFLFLVLAQVRVIND